MNVLSTRVALRDRTLLDVFDLALRFVVSHAAAYAKMSACVSLPALGVSWLAARAWGWGWGWAIALCLAAFVEAPFVALASRLVFEEDVPTRGALAMALRALPRLMVARALEVVGVAGGALFFLLPAVWIATLFFFVTEVVVLEDAGVSTAVSRGQRLGTGWFGDVVAAMLLWGCLYAVVVVLGGAAGRILVEQLLQVRVGTGDEDALAPLALFAFWLAVPVLTTARFFVYLNLRTRREGWDIQTRFAAIAARARAPEDR